MDISVNEIFDGHEQLDFSSSNTWLQLLAHPLNTPLDLLPATKKPHPNCLLRVIYTYDHELVTKARKLKLAGELNNNQIAKQVGVCPKTISRWKEKGFLSDQKPD